MMTDVPPFELSGFQRDLLYVIAGCDKPSGQTIRRELEKYVDDVGHGRVYTNLDILVDNSLIEKGSHDQRTNYYSITAAGSELLYERRKWENAVTETFEVQNCQV